MPGKKPRKISIQMAGKIKKQKLAAKAINAVERKKQRQEIATAINIVQRKKLATEVKRSFSYRAFKDLFERYGRQALLKSIIYPEEKFWDNKVFRPKLEKMFEKRIAGKTGLTIEKLKKLDDEAAKLAMLPASQKKKLVKKLEFLDKNIARLEEESKLLRSALGRRILTKEENFFRGNADDFLAHALTSWRGYTSFVLEDLGN